MSGSLWLIAFSGRYIPFYPVAAILDFDLQKRLAARRALDYVYSGARLGLGTGSTADHFIDLLGERVANGFEVTAVPTSESTRLRAIDRGIPLATLDQLVRLDVLVDGADEVTPDLILVKGGGGAHLREKIVALAADKVIVIIDSRKYVSSLGKFPLPLEIVPFGAFTTLFALEERIKKIGLSCHFIQRLGDSNRPFVTENGNYIFDGHFSFIPDPIALDQAICSLTGLVAHGLFINIADVVIIGRADGSTSVLNRESS